jgi:transcription elongation GreA/GreB family factor
MSDRAAGDAVEAEVRSALAVLEASRERVYYDADEDASIRAGYKAAIDEQLSPEQRFRALGDRLERTHAPRSPYKPTERVYP